MLVSAQISHYKSIGDAYLRFDKINVIVGPNGSGKSNILDALYFLRDCAVDDIDTAITKRHGIDSIRQWARTRPYNIIIAAEFRNEDGIGDYKVVISSNKGQYKIIEEAGSWLGPFPRRRHNNEEFPNLRQSSFKRHSTGELEFNTTIEELRNLPLSRIDQDELFLSYLSSRGFIPSFIMFRPLVDEISSFSRYNIYPNTLRGAQLLTKESTLIEDGSNLASILKKMNSNKRYSESKDDIVSALQRLMPMLEDFQVRSAAGFYVPVLRVRENGGEVHDFNLSQISDGTLRTLGLLAAFYQPLAPDRIGIEEPELMVHPGALSVLSEAMLDYVNKRPYRQRQVFVTTHSPTLIDQFPPESLIWTRVSDGVTKCGHVSERQLDIIKEQLFTAGELLLAEGIFS